MLYPDYSSMQLLTGISIIFFILLLWHNFVNQNILYGFRNFMLGSIGYLAASVISINPAAYFSSYMRESQTINITYLILIATNLALIASQLGFYYAARTTVKKRLIVEYDNKKSLGVAVLIIAIFSFILIHNSSGLVLFQLTGSVYGTDDTHTISINISSVYLNLTCMYLMFYVFKYKTDALSSIKNPLWVYLLVLFVVLSNTLIGFRQNSLSLLLSLLMFYGIYETGHQRLKVKHLLILIALFLFAQFVGFYRTVSLTTGGFWQALQTLFQVEAGVVSFQQGTLNDLAATFSGVIYLLQNHVLSPLYGLSYLDWIPRTLPQFMYPGRPQDLAWVFVNSGYQSGGGFFELAEAYYNFGLLGCFLIPFILSFLLGYIYKRLIVNKYSTIDFFMFFAIMASILRGGWYQSFAWYKSWIAGLCLYVFICILANFKWSYRIKENK